MSQVSALRSQQPTLPPGEEPPATTGAAAPPKMPQSGPSAEKCSADLSVIEAFRAGFRELTSEWAEFPSGPTVSAGSLTASAFPKAGVAKDDSGREFPTSADGTPRYRQGDEAWASRQLGESSSIGAAGCAMTSTAMALSKISGQTITPGQLDAFLDANAGYSGNAIFWDKAAGAVGLHADKPAWNVDLIDQQLDAGRPVVIGVDSRAGSKGGSNGTDHWIALTGRGTKDGKPVYFANDPATGQEITLRLEHGRLVGGPQAYKSTGELVTFSGGPSHPSGPPTSAHSGDGAARRPTASSVTTPAGASGTTMLKGLAIPARTLKEGARGADVEKLQALLVRAGYLSEGGDLTRGVLDAKTKAALQAFQAAHGKKPDGICGPQTRAAFAALGAEVARP